MTTNLKSTHLSSKYQPTASWWTTFRRHSYYANYLRRRATRIVQRILLVYFVLLVLVHGINNLLLGNTAGYLAAFSAPAYPYVATVVLLAAALFTAKMRPKGDSH